MSLGNKKVSRFCESSSSERTVKKFLKFPDKAIPPEVCSGGFRFGHTLLGNARFEVVQFVFGFYGFETYNALVNPNKPLVRAVLTALVESGDYFFFATSILSLAEQLKQGAIPPNRK